MRCANSPAQWAMAIVCHSNMFHSPIWTLAYPENRTKRIRTMMEKGEYLISHQINSGMSLGIFDLEYKYYRPESETTGGKLYWEPNDLDADGLKLLEQMDFPLCSIAIAYDGINELKMEKLMLVLKGDAVIRDCLP
jgi:hypothetical protein